MRILICGDRGWTDRAAIARRLTSVMTLHNLKSSDVLVIEGGATGADTLARGVAEAQGIAVAEFPAAWTALGRAAGPIRNRWMLRWGMPDLVLAFHPFIDNSKGTKDMVHQAQRAGVEVLIYES